MLHFLALIWYRTLVYIYNVVDEKIKFETYHVDFFLISVFHPNCSGNMGMITGWASGLKRVKSMVALSTCHLRFLL